MKMMTNTNTTNNTKGSVEGRIREISVRFFT